MFKLLRTGLVAALIQSVACSAALILVQLSPAAQRSEETVLSLNWSLLVIAIGLSLTTGRSLDETATALARASRRSGMPIASLISGLTIATLGFFVLALRPPPPTLLSLVNSVFGELAGSLAWTTLMSIGLAAFGSTTHAAVRAARRKKI